MPTAVEEARRALHSTQRLYDGQLSNLLARVGGDGYLSTSVYGGYTGKPHAQSLLLIRFRNSQP